MAFLLPYIPHLISAAASIGGGLLSKGKQGNNKELIDQLLASINGDGPFSDMFNMDEDAFQKSFVDPAKQRFQDQISPQIQQSFISSGQQRGTGLDDTLTRAGVNMDQMLNQQYMGFQEKGKDRMSNMLNQILGAKGGQGAQSFGSSLGDSAGGYLQGDAFQKLMDQIFKGKDDDLLDTPTTTSRPGWE